MIGRGNGELGRGPTWLCGVCFGFVWGVDGIVSGMDANLLVALSQFSSYD